jgi:hypothetical protein
VLEVRESIMKLSCAQKVFLIGACGPQGKHSPGGGGRRAGIVHAAWHRTAESLARRGLVTVEYDMARWGYVAKATDVGRQSIVVASAG